MRALSVKQPWASLIIGWTDDHAIWHDGPKPIENRSWRPPADLIGQRIVIHASKREDDSVGASLLGAKHIYNPGASDITVHGTDYPGRSAPLPAGAVIGVATLAGFVDSMSVLCTDDREWYMGEIGLVFRNRIALPEPIPCKGALGFWRLPADVEQLVRDGIEAQERAA